MGIISIGILLLGVVLCICSFFVDAVVKGFYLSNAWAEGLMQYGLTLMGAGTIFLVIGLLYDFLVAAGL